MLISRVGGHCGVAGRNAGGADDDEQQPTADNIVLDGGRSAGLVLRTSDGKGAGADTYCEHYMNTAFNIAWYPSLPHSVHKKQIVCWIRCRPRVRRCMAQVDAVIHRSTVIEDEEKNKTWPEPTNAR